MTIQRNYEHINEYLDELAGDVYSQPEDFGHTQMAIEVFDAWIAPLELDNVLDVGCGAEAFMERYFVNRGIAYAGISIGDDVVTAQAAHKNVFEMDMSFLTIVDDSINLVWARHVLEHSPFPLLTLMEWHRVSSHWLCLIMPNPEYFTDAGRNHYSVFSAHHIAWLLRRAGWKIVRHELVEQEFRFLCSKEPRISYEGYVAAPLSTAIHEYERETFG